MLRTARNLLLVGVLVGTVMPASLLAQTTLFSREPEPAVVDGTIRFSDDPQVGLTRCSIVNTSGEELFLRQCDRRLVLARTIFSLWTIGNTIPEDNKDALTPYIVGHDLLVTDTRTGENKGKIDFAFDGDGLRTVFWLADASFPPVDGAPVQGVVLSIDRNDMQVSPLTPFVDENSEISFALVRPEDLGFESAAGRGEVFLPCGADRAIIDVTQNGVPALGCSFLTPYGCGGLNPLLFLSASLVGIGLIRRWT